MASSSSSAAMTASVPGSSSNVDPRDVRDRSYLQSAIRKMASYLSLRGYADASSLNVNQLVNSGPSGRDFQNITTFLPLQVRSDLPLDARCRSREQPTERRGGVEIRKRGLHGIPMPRISVIFRKV